MSIVATRKIWYAISVVSVGLSLLATAVWGLKPSIEFTGGSLAEYTFANKTPTTQELKAAIEETGITGVTIVTSDRGLMARMPLLEETKHKQLTDALQKKIEGLQEARFDAIGPSISTELRQKAIFAVGAMMVMVLGYVAWAYRKVSSRIESWKYGALVVLSGLHDAIIPVGVFAALGHFYGTEIGGAFIAAILTILGYSINDTIVVFDRVRENILRTDGTFAEIVDRSIRQAMMRSINTTVTVLLALLAIYFFGGESTKDFSLALFIGFAVGAYSSIFLVSPLLVTWQKKKGVPAGKTAKA